MDQKIKVNPKYPMMRPCVVSLPKLDPNQIPKKKVQLQKDDLRNKLTKFKSQVQRSSVNLPFPLKLKIKKDKQEYFVTNECACDISQDEEDELLADADTMSTVSEMICEDELLNDSEADNNNLPEETIKNVDKNAPPESDIFETMSLAAEDDFMEELAEPKLHAYKGKISTPNYNDKVKNWQEKAPYENNAFERPISLPKKNPLPRKKNPKKKFLSSSTITNPRHAVNKLHGYTQKNSYNQSKQHHNNTSQINQNLQFPSSRLVHNNSEDLRDIMTTKKVDQPRKICFEFRDYGTCKKTECKFLHIQNHKSSDIPQDDQNQQIHHTNNNNITTTTKNNNSNNFRHIHNRTHQNFPTLSNDHLDNFQANRTKPSYNARIDKRQNKQRFPIPPNTSYRFPLTRCMLVQNNLQYFPPPPPLPPPPPPPPPQTRVNKISGTMITPSDCKDKSFEELREILKGNISIESKWEIIKAMDQHLKSESFMDTNGPKFLVIKNIIEKTLLEIHNNTSSNLNYRVEIARNLLSMKTRLDSVKRQDLLILADCESKVKNYPVVKNILCQMREAFEIRALSNEESDKNDFLEFTIRIIEQEALIFEFWNDFRDIVIHSYRAVDKIFSHVDFKMLKERLEQKDVDSIFQNFTKNKEFHGVSGTSKTNFLCLLSMTRNSSDLLEFLTIHMSTLTTIPKLVVQAVLQLSTSVADQMQLFTVLKGMTKIVSTEVWQEFQELWNSLLIHLCRKGDDSTSIQTVEQYYGLMQECKIVPSIKCALKMLSGFIKTSYFEIFEKHYQDFVKLNLFPANYFFPKDFAQDVGDHLDKYTREDKNGLHYMVMILLSSSCPPPESSITEVLQMLVAKRRFADVYKLVDKCFENSVILSQYELRRVVYALEEWQQNVSASVDIYSKMRHTYRRPEHQCVCGGNVKPQTITIRSSSSGELASPKSSVSSHEVGEQEIQTLFNTTIPIPLFTDPLEGEAVRLATELSQASENSKVFTDLFIKGWEKKLVSNNKFVSGVFLGLTNSSEPASFFKTFITDLMARNDGSIHDAEHTLGLVGIRLVKYLHNERYLSKAASTINLLHEYGIRYVDCLETFGNQIITNEQITTTHIAELCFECCIHDKKYMLAKTVYEHIKDSLLEENESYLYQFVTKLLHFLVLQYPSEALVLLNQYHREIDISISEGYFNSIILSFEKERNVGEVFNIVPLMKDFKYVIFKDTLKVLVNIYGKYNRMNDARSFFMEGSMRGVFKNCFDPSRPFQCEVPIKYRSTELYFTIEHHIWMLCENQIYGLQRSLKSPLYILVVPGDGDDLDTEEFEKYATMNKIAPVLVKEFSPPLTLLGSEAQRYIVCPKSIAVWFNHVKKNSPSLYSPQTQMLRTRKRRIENDSDNLRVEFAPTPQPNFPSNQTESEYSQNELLLIENNVPSKRILKEFPATTDLKDAKKTINKIIYNMLSEYYLKTHHIVPEELNDTTNKLRVLFFEKMRRENEGRLFYNQHVYDVIRNFIDEYFTNLNSAKRME